MMEVFSLYKNPKKRGYFLGIVYLFVLVIFPDNLCSDNYKNKKISNIDFENIATQNTVKYSKYDSYEFQFKDFFGLSNPLNEVDHNINYQDLTVELDSENIRSLYLKKLEQMTNLIDSNLNNNNWNFYNEKI